MDRFRTNDGADIAFRYVGGEAPAVVLVHGAYLASSEWRPQRPALEGRAHVLVDLRGHGASSRGGYPYSVDLFADDLRQLLEHLRLEGAVLCGHSLGGMVVQRVAARHGELAQKLVLADTSYGVRSTRAEAFLTDLTLPLFDLVPVRWQARLFADQIGKHSADARAYVEEEIGRHAEDRRNYRAIWRAVTRFDGYASLSEIRCPTLVVVGALNEQTHRQARVMQERIADARLVFIERAGHMLNRDDPARFNRVLLEFVEG